MIVAGDIGGTNARLATFEVVAEGRLHCLTEKVYSSRSAPDLETIARRFMEEVRPTPTAAALGVAGPVQAGRSVTPNLPWVVDSSALASVFGVPRVWLLNDLEANAHGLLHLEAKDFAVLQPGAAGAVGNRAILSAGTGLGVAGLYWDGRKHHPFATEGGHSDFGPRNRLEAELMESIARVTGRVSVERVVSGGGLVTVYQFLRERSGVPEPSTLAARFAREDRAAVISTTALAGTDPVCGQALDLFVSLYGAEAGNMALSMLATGGMYLGGGIAPKILPRLRDPELFLASFLAKGRMRSLMESIPVLVVLNDRTALWGAAQVAAFEER